MNVYLYTMFDAMSIYSIICMHASLMILYRNMSTIGITLLDIPLKLI